MAIGGPDRADWSYRIFHNRHLLDVALWIEAHEGELVTVRKIAAALGLADGTVRPVVARLEAMGLVESIRGVTRQEVPIESKASGLWQIFQMVDALPYDRAASGPSHEQREAGERMR